MTYSRRLDSAVRQNVLDGIRSLANAAMIELGREFGADGIEISAHRLCAEDHLPYQGKQFSMQEFEDLQNRLHRPFGMWNCKHSMHPILLGVSKPAYSDEQLEEYRKFSSEKIEIDGVTKSRYEWTQEQRRLETAVRRQKDISICARASGDGRLRRDAQRNINALMDRYDRITEVAGVTSQYNRMKVAGFKYTDEKELKADEKSGMLITSKQIGKKSGKHMNEWGLDPSSPDDRLRFIYISNNIYTNPDEVRSASWSVDPVTKKRTVEVKAYIKGNDVVLVDKEGKYITTMKDGINNKRIQGGKKVEE